MLTSSMLLRGSRYTTQTGFPSVFSRHTTQNATLTCERCACAGKTDMRESALRCEVCVCARVGAAHAHDAREVQAHALSRRCQPPRPHAPSPPLICLLSSRFRFCTFWPSVFRSCFLFFLHLFICSSTRLLCKVWSRQHARCKSKHENPQSLFFLY